MFLKVLQTRYENILVQEECLQELAHSPPARLDGQPTCQTAVEQRHSNGRPEQSTRAKHARLHTVVEGGEQSGVEIVLGHPVTPWAS